MDAFLDLLPDKLMGHPDGLVFDTTERDGIIIAPARRLNA